MSGENEKQCLPISKLEDVWQWKCENACNWKTTPLQPSTDYCYKGSSTSCHVLTSEWEYAHCLDRRSFPKTLLCHDMKGGYTGDRFVDGTQDSESYRFYHWAGIDIFVYFSHHLITIPPPVWVNAAHLHGVKVLGTFITEWKDGEKICQEILKNSENRTEFVKKLVEISDHYGFDGWLLNIENKVSDDVGDVLDLVTLVSQLTREMHMTNSDSLVIWYDSVTCPLGTLDWQNELNLCNRAFFDSCDGIFTNYSWDEENLKVSQLNAKDRCHDVYVGMDVFGRNFYEGGGFNTHKAVEVARKYGLSIAIFAPGWVHENHEPRDFTELEYHFWNTVRPQLYLHGPTKLPFETSFCQGAGLKKYHLGNEVSSTPWYNLSLQQYQPCMGSCGFLHFEENQIKSELRVPGCVETYMNDAFNGGNSLIFRVPHTSIKNSADTQPSSIITAIQRIFICDFFCREPFLVSLATKKLDEDSKLSIIVKIKDLNGKYSSILLQENEVADCKMKGTITLVPIDGLQTEKLKKKYDSIDALKYGTSKAIGGDGWLIRNYEVMKPMVSIVEIGALMGQRGSVLLGFLRIQELNPRK